MSGEFHRLLAELLRREITLEDVRAEYAGTRTQDRDDSERKALFYAGVRAYEDGNVEETRRLWGQAPVPTDEAELEYYLLVHERERLGP